MLTDRLERRYAKIRKELDTLLAKMKTLTPHEVKRWNRLEAELFDVERRLLRRSLVFAN